MSKVHGRCRKLVEGCWRLGALAFVLTTGCAETMSETVLTGTVPVINISAATGRDLRSISTNPASDTWLFVECLGTEEPIGCHLVTYDARKSHLRRFMLSGSYLYAYPRFSSDGQHILVNRFPKHDGTPEGLAASTLATETIMVDADGGKMRVLIAAGPNIGSVLSPSGNSIAYWKTTPKLSSSSRMNSGPFDLYIRVLKTGEEVIFSGTNQFYSAGALYFKTEDSVLSTAEAPKQRNASDLFEYRRETNGSEIYQFERGAKSASAVFVDIKNARAVSFDSSGDVCLIGERPNGGNSFIKIKADGFRQFIAVPYVSFITEAACTFDGKKLIFVYPADHTSFAERKFGLGLVDWSTGTTEPVKLPPLRDADVIRVD